MAPGLPIKKERQGRGGGPVFLGMGVGGLGEKNLFPAADAEQAQQAGAEQPGSAGQRYG